MKSIEVQNLSKVFDNPLSGRLVVLDGISFTVEFGGFLSILGPSGSGKSLLLQIIAGLERPTEGTIRLGHPGAEPAAAGPAHANGSAHRNGSRIGFVFQAPRLLPWKRAGENIRYVLTGRSLGRSEERTARSSISSSRCSTRPAIVGRTSANPQSVGWARCAAANASRQK